jgi:hypothetical protein
MLALCSFHVIALRDGEAGELPVQSLPTDFV